MFVVHGNHNFDGFAELVGTEADGLARVAEWTALCDRERISPRLPTDQFWEAVAEAQDGGDWKGGPDVTPWRACVPTDLSRAAKARLALAMLRAARDLFDEAGSKRTARSLRAVLASAEGATRAAAHRDDREARAVG